MRTISKLNSVYEYWIEVPKAVCDFFPTQAIIYNLKIFIKLNFSLTREKWEERKANLWILHRNRFTSKENLFDLKAVIRNRLFLIGSNTVP